MEIKINLRFVARVVLFVLIFCLVSMWAKDGLVRQFIMAALLLGIIFTVGYISMYTTLVRVDQWLKDMLKEAQKPNE